MLPMYSTVTANPYARTTPRTEMPSAARAS